MPRMTVKPSRPLGVLRWHAHCPVCPYVSLPLIGSSHAGDDARRHAESHRCPACRAGVAAIPNPSAPGDMVYLPCWTCRGRGWV